MMVKSCSERFHFFLSPVSRWKNDNELNRTLNEHYISCRYVFTNKCKFVLFDCLSALRSIFFIFLSDFYRTEMTGNIMLPYRQTPLQTERNKNSLRNALKRKCLQRIYRTESSRIFNSSTRSFITSALKKFMTFIRTGHNVYLRK